MNKNVFVTGATGFVGHHLCKRLYEDGYRVFASGRKDENKIKCHELYTTRLQNIPLKEIPKIDICFHLAANNDYKDEQATMDTNYNVSSLFFKSLLDAGCNKFIYASSCSVYGNNSNPLDESSPLCASDFYSKSKIAFESFCNGFSRRNKAVCIGLRYTNIYGTHELHKKRYSSAINQIIQKIYKNEMPIVPSNVEQAADWVYVLDVVDANILASKHNQSDIFNIGAGRCVSFNNIVDIINRKMNKSIVFKKIDNFDSINLQSSVKIDKAKNTLKYIPKYTVEDGIQDIKIRLKKLFDYKVQSASFLR